jgi:hypothetical protein
MRAGVAAAGLLIALITAPAPAQAEEPPKAPCITCGTVGSADVAAAGEDLEVTFRKGKSDHVPNRPGPDNVYRPEITTWDTIEESAVPTCYGNRGPNADVMCMAAATACAADDQVQFWIYHQVTHHEVGKPDVVGPWTKEPGSYCLGPDDPGPDNGVAQAFAFVQSEFARLPLPRIAPKVEPAPKALVNVPTVFSAGSADAVHFTRSFGAFTFDITAKPQTWTWHYGEGEPDPHTGPGTPGDPDDTSHTYTKAGTYKNVYVAVTWGGTFTVTGSSEVFPIRGTATVSSPRTQVDVRQARSQLVR